MLRNVVRRAPPVTRAERSHRRSIHSPSSAGILDALVTAGRLADARLLARQLRAAGLHRSLPARNALLRVLSLSPRTLPAALRLFDRMPHRDSRTYSILVSALCRHATPSAAAELLRSVPPPLAVAPFTALLHALLQNRLPDLALKVFDEMRHKGVTPNSTTYTALVHGLCQCGRAAEALRIVSTMEATRSPPNASTYASVVGALCSSNMLKEASEIMDRMRLQGRKTNAGLHAKLISALVNVGKCHEAASSLDELMLSGPAANRSISGIHVQMHNLVIRGLCVSGRDPARAFQVYLSARTRAVGIEPETCNSLVGGLCSSGDACRAARLVEEMLREGLAPDRHAWESVACWLLACGKAQDAVGLVLDRVKDECCIHA